MRAIFAISLAFVFYCMPAYGETVEDATNRYFQIMKSKDYVAAVTLFDPAELRSFRESLDFLVNLPAASQEELYGSLFGPGSTQESVNQLSDSEFFASFFTVAMSQAGISDLMGSAKTEYLGHVMEGDNVAHAVMRITVQTPEAELETTSVASFVKRGDSWKMKLSGDIRGVADRIREAVGM